MSASPLGIRYPDDVLLDLATTGLLGGALDAIRQRCGAYDLLAHWQQGEFHHDVVLRIASHARAGLPGAVLVIAINCNGGVKELLCFDEVPDRWALWHWRCPSNPEFGGDLPPLLSRLQTEHWFDPCELLADDARSELRPACRRRARGGGWEKL
jgi:hypothetical protein